MNTKNRNNNKTVLVIIMVCVSIIVAFFAGMSYGEYNAREEISSEGTKKSEYVSEYIDDKDNEMFHQGLLAGVDYMSINMLYESGAMSDDDYEYLMESLEKYIENPSEENMNSWYEIFEETMLNGVLPDKG